jgi:hypothetical protein
MSKTITLQQCIDAWNVQADKLNQWSELDSDERCEWCLKMSRPDGWILVPIEPTSEMFKAGEETFVPCYTGTPVSEPNRVWVAMIKAVE